MNEPLDKKAKDINIINYIYDEEFISIINSLSSAIKDYFQNFKLSVNTLKNQTDIINDHTLSAKSAISDVLLYLAQTRSKVNPTTSEKFIFEKGHILSEKMDKINEIKSNLFQSIKCSETSFLSFYDIAKELFKKMKIIRSHKIDEINAKINFEEYIEKQKDKKSITPTHQNITISNKKQNTNQSLDSSQNSSQRFNTCNTVGNTINVKNVNLLNQSSEDYIKKNENLISEITLIKFKYSELMKENQNLKNTITKLKSYSNTKDSQSLQSSTNSYGKSAVVNVKESFTGIGLTKSKSLPKHNNYVACNTTETDDRNTRKGNPIVSSGTSTKVISKKPSQYITKPTRPVFGLKKTFSIDNKKFIKLPNEPNTNIKLVTTPANVNVPIEQHHNKPLSNSNSTNNTICINTTNTNSLNNSFSTQANLATLVIAFISQMKALQESISGHQDNVKEMKKSFELKKKELIKISESILGTSGNVNNTSLTVVNSLNNTPRTASKKQALPPNKTHTDNISKIEIELSQLKLTKQELEKKIKNEKSISSLYEEKLSEEKSKNKELNESLSQAQEQLTEITQVSSVNKNKVESLEISNNELLQVIQNHKNTISQSANDIDCLKKTNDQLLKDNNDLQRKITSLTENNKIITEETNSFKAEIVRLKSLITECNQNIITISNTNEAIISEKDLIIKKHSNKLEESQKEMNDLLAEIKSYKDQIKSLETKLTDNQVKSKDSDSILKCSNESELIQDLNQKISKYEKDLLDSKRENRDLMNKISQIKNEYLTYDEERKIIEKLLIEINTDTNINLNEIQNKISKQSDKSSIEPKQANNVKDDCCSLVIKCNEGMRKINKTLEDKLNSDISKDTILQQNQGLKKELAKAQEENEKMRYFITLYQGKDSVSNRNNPNKTLSNINEQNSNFIDDDLSNVSGIFLEYKKDDKEFKTDRKEFNQINSNSNLTFPFLNNNIISELKQAFENLISSIQIIGIVKDYALKIFKLLNYREEDIEAIINKNDKTDNIEISQSSG